MTVLDRTIETRERLLEAAGEVFAEQGFHKATVRDICGRADVNIAAVNYHFRDKESLYEAVLKHWAEVAIQKYPPNLGLRQGATAEERLGAFVRSLLFRVLDEGRPAWHGKLMARETSDPTPAFEKLVEESFRPLYNLLTAIVTELLGSRAEQVLVRHCVGSVIGQCLFYHHCRPAADRLMPEQTYETGDIERLADHVTTFSLAALRRFSNAT